MGRLPPDVGTGSCGDVDGSHDERFGFGGSWAGH